MRFPLHHPPCYTLNVFFNLCTTCLQQDLPHPPRLRGCAGIGQANTKKARQEDLAYPLLTCDWRDATVGFAPSSLKWCYLSFKRFTSSFNTELLFARRIPHSLSENLAIPLAAGPHTDTHTRTHNIDTNAVAGTSPAALLPRPGCACVCVCLWGGVFV